MTTTGTRFVMIPADRLVAELDSIGNAVKARGGDFAWRVQGKERVFDLTVPGAKAMVRVFTSLASGAATVRDCGKDAVRVCVGALVEDTDDFGKTGALRFKPTEKGTKILRTAPQGGDRVQVFLDRLRDVIREAYVRAREVRSCPKCGRPMAVRVGKFGNFLGCTGYPECKGLVNL